MIKKQRDVERGKLRKKFRNRKTEIDMEKDRDRQTQTDGQINRNNKGNIDRE